MSNPTTPFGWQMPTNTDLVTDLPADFEVFGQAVATSMADLLGGTTGQVLAKNTNADMDFVWTSPNPGDITEVTAGTGISGGGTSGAVTITNSMATEITTSGDLIQGTGSGTFARLGSGTNGQFLTTNGTTLSWTAAPTAGANWSLLNAGGTALTGAGTITVSGISGKDKIMVLMNAASTTITTSPEIGLRLNTDTGGNYAMTGVNFSSASYAPSRVSTLTNTYITLAKQNTTAASTFAGAITLTGCNSSGVKAYQAVGGAEGSGSAFNIIQGYYNSSSTISSISLFTESGNFDAGTVYVYTSA